MIPINEVRISKKDIKSVVKSLKSNEISGNSKGNIDKFESKVAFRCHKLYGIATSNGTTALHLALMASNIGPGDEVIVPSLTMAATAFAVIHAGAKPIVVDIDKDNWCIDPYLIKKAITKKTKAIIPVYLYGNPCDMDSIMEIANDCDLTVIGDTAEAFGAEYKDFPIESYGHMSCLSFYATKMITTGEGGMIVTSDLGINERARSIRNMNFGGNLKYMHKGVGYNYRMSNILASLGLSQLDNIRSIINRKRINHYLYKSLLPKDIQMQYECEKSVWWMNAIIVDDRDRIRSELLNKGIQTGDIFESLSTQNFIKSKECPIAENIAKQGMLLPSSSWLKEGEIKYICDCLKEII